MGQNIVLIGFMGSGKSAVSRELSHFLKRELLSTDALIEKNEGSSIPEIFEKAGEAYFRKVEKEAVFLASQQENVIIDCGGGVILDADNFSNLKKTGITIYLCTSPDEIYTRVKNSTHRPLLNVDDPKAKIKEILDARRSLYEQADLIIDTDGKSIQEVCNSIITNINNSK